MRSIWVNLKTDFLSNFVFLLCVLCDSVVSLRLPPINMNMPTIDEALLIWDVAIEREYATAGTWIPWADAMILQLDQPPDWLIDLCVAKSREQAIQAVHRGLRTLPIGPGEQFDWVGHDLGFLYLCYEYKAITLRELLIKAGSKTDACTHREDCSAYYFLLNEIEGQKPILPSKHPISQRIQAIFRPDVELARKSWARLMAMVND